MKLIHLSDLHLGKRLNEFSLLEDQSFILEEILRITEGDIAPVSCVECDAASCGRQDDCRTLPMWKELKERIADYVDHVTLADLMNKAEEV